MSSSWRAAANRALARIGGASRRWRLGQADGFLVKAERRTGLSDWGNPGYRDGLEALLESVRDQPDLTPLGVLTFANLIDQLLVNRLHFSRAALPRRPLEQPTIITGLPRSGTTFLHRMLCLDPTLYAPPLWELLDPFSTTSPTYRRLRATLQVSVKNRLLPDLDHKHFTRAHTPEECTLLLANSFASPLFSDMAPLTTYLRWLQAANLDAVYSEYRTQLEILQARHPDRRLVLKAPAHLGNLAVLHQVVPEARLVQIHRDPTDCFFSHCSLRETLARFVVEQPSRTEIAGLVQSTFEHDLRSCLTFHEDCGREVIHVAYSRLCAVPLEVAREIQHLLELERGPEPSRRTTTYVRRTPHHRFGTHRYHEESWGISRARVNGLFGDYRDRFAAALA